MSTRDAYIEKLKAKLDLWNAELDRLQAKASEKSADAQIEYERELKHARARQEEAQSRLDELRDASADAWDDVKRGADSAWDALRDAVEHARSRFK